MIIPQANFEGFDVSRVSNLRTPLIPETQPHVPHPYCIVMLRGMQTRFFRSREEFDRGLQAIPARHPKECYEYSFLRGNQYVPVQPATQSDDASRTG